MQIEQEMQVWHYFSRAF